MRIIITKDYAHEKEVIKNQFIVDEFFVSNGITSAAKSIYQSKKWD